MAHFSFNEISSDLFSFTQLWFIEDDFMISSIMIRAIQGLLQILLVVQHVSLSG